MNIEQDRQKKTFSLFTIILALIFLYTFGIMFCVYGIGATIKEGISIYGLIITFVGILPVFTGTYVLLNLFRKDKTTDVKEETLFEKILCFFYSMIGAAFFFFLYILMHALDKQKTLPYLVVKILDVFFIASAILCIFIAVGTHRTRFNKRRLIRFLVALILLILILLYILNR